MFVCKLSALQRYSKMSLIWRMGTVRGEHGVGGRKGAWWLLAGGIRASRGTFSSLYFV